ncbi:hypothetical protein FISHEDRAFT_63192 [Fistulina hepatica ATCC 64428]|uniref:Ubiquitin-like domain-containing protein n=1 Tax=Fistulina hepatica ATCC 64428 TaxID=1128425 RepID=A0A0D7AQ46_9AGAR|nr:hypothetical protein FISHEDRAFT_63192 [Fistulina hepatica ATCC 64428]
MSEKAKGKQRALDPLPVNNRHVAGEASGNSSSSTLKAAESRQLTIRFTEGVPDLTITVDQLDTVGDVKKKIRQVRPELEGRRLRLIHSGRLLTNGVFLFSWLATLEERQLRSVSREAEGGASDSKPPIDNIWLHCSIGPPIEDDKDGDEGANQPPQIRPPRGFDRLAAIGFSEADITNFRRQFHSQSSANYLDSEFETEEEYNEHARALEEQWIDSMDNAGTASLSQSPNSDSAVLQGIVVGFFFPLIPFFFLATPKAPVFWDDGREHETPNSVVFSKRMQMSIVVGFFMNVLFGVWMTLLNGS